MIETKYNRAKIRAELERIAKATLHLAAMCETLEGDRLYTDPQLEAAIDRRAELLDMLQHGMTHWGEFDPEPQTQTQTQKDSSHGNE